MLYHHRLAQGGLSILGGENMEKNSERRSSPRAEIRWPVTIKTGQGIIEAKLRNLGIGGAYIHCERHLKPEKPLP